MEKYLFTEKDYIALNLEITELGKEEAKLREDINEHLKSCCSDERGSVSPPISLQNIRSKLQNLRKILSKVEVVRFLPDLDKVNFGSLVTIIDDDTDQKRHIRISSYKVLTKEDGVENISYSSPLGKLLIGSGVDDSVSGEIAGTIRNFTIESISF